MIITKCVLTSFSLHAATDALDVTISTQPAGPSYKAGSLYYVTCTATNGVPLYQYAWSVGCSYTNTFSSYILAPSTIGPYTTTSINCRNVYRCRATDGTSAIAYSQTVSVEIITGSYIKIIIAFQLFCMHEQKLSQRLHLYFYRYCNSDFS